MPDIPCIINWTCIIFVCASCHAYGVVFIVCSLLFLECFFSIEFRKRIRVWGFIQLRGSSISRILSSSKRVHRQDDHFLRYHYYHCYGSCLVYIAMPRCLPPINASLPTLTWQSSNPSTFQQITLWLCYRLLSLLIVFLVGGAVSSMWQHGYSFDNMGQRSTRGGKPGAHTASGRAPAPGPRLASSFWYISHFTLKLLWEAFQDEESLQRGGTRAGALLLSDGKIPSGTLPSRKGKSKPLSSPTTLSCGRTNLHQHHQQHHLISNPCSSLVFNLCVRTLDWYVWLACSVD